MARSLIFYADRYFRKVALACDRIRSGVAAVTFIRHYYGAPNSGVTRRHKIGTPCWV